VARPLAVGVGQATVAIYGTVPRLPEHDAPVDLTEVSVQAGGAAAIACAAVQGLGCKARLATKVADDFLGPFILRALAQAGLDVHEVLGAQSRLSAFGFTARASENRRRAGFRSDGDVGDLAPDELDIEGLLDGANAVVIDGHFPAAQVALAERARLRDIPVVFGAHVVREGTGELLGLADVLIASERLASELAPRGEPRDSLVELQKLGPRAAILTMGEAGSIGLYGDRLVEQEAYPIDAVDTDGTGSVYLGAFVTALLNQLPFAKCMEFASAAAALSCARVGAWAGIPTRDEVIRVIRKGR
jgi:sugar/nucleoside kinase (ribokinase family)